jgi:hypothetical protein
MCVERTARTKLPSARGSRASVARQKRAAVRGEILDGRCVFLVVMMFILNIAKITQTGKQIYPVWRTKRQEQKKTTMVVPGSMARPSGFASLR